MITRAGSVIHVELVQLDHAADKEHLTESMRRIVHCCTTNWLSYHVTH
jgi:hypothetical protein